MSANNIKKRQHDNDNKQEEDQQLMITTKTQKKQKKKQPEKQLPPALERLQTIFSRLNTFCAFCDARLLTVLTWTRIQSSVTDVNLTDLAAINVILPHFITFTFQEEQGELTIQFGKLISKRVAREKQSTALQNKGDDWEYSKYSSKSNIKPDQIKKTVDTRNHRFQQALSKFVLTCHKKVFILFFPLLSIIIILPRNTFPPSFYYPMHFPQKNSFFFLRKKGGRKLELDFTHKMGIINIY